MKESGTSNWISPNTGGTNESGFTALPSGFRHWDGLFGDAYGWTADWWTSNQNGADYAPNRRVSYNNSGIATGNVLKKTGGAVRCIKD